MPDCAKERRLDVGIYGAKPCWTVAMKEDESTDVLDITL
jgi:hypothetical protein